MKFSSVHHIHFVGIGGAGMSGIAEILLSQGFHVTGSDLAVTETTEHLIASGASISYGHRAENIEGAEVYKREVIHTLADPVSRDGATAEAGDHRGRVVHAHVGRTQHHDMRDVTVSQFMQRYHVDSAQARRVATLALAMCGVSTTFGAVHSPPSGFDSSTAESTSRSYPDRQPRLPPP